MKQFFPLIAMGLSLFGALLPQMAEAQARPSIIVVDATTGRVLVAQDVDKKRPVASLTKMATAAVVLDWARLTKTKLSTVAIVPASVAQIGGANPMGLQPGDQIALRDALYSALLGSDNVAAQTLANFVGRELLIHRQIAGDPVAVFVKEMNELAKLLGMKRTKFANPHGMDGGRWRQGYSTAADMAILTARVTRDSRFLFFVKQKSRQVSYARQGVKKSFVVKNTNRLVGKNHIVGGKTGSTRLAGPCLAVGSEKLTLKQDLPDGRKLLTKRFLVSVVLGSPDRFDQTGAVLDQSWKIFEDWRLSGFENHSEAMKFLSMPK